MDKIKKGMEQLISNKAKKHGETNELQMKEREQETKKQLAQREYVETED